jgi:glycosyltransferase involved in cell wall biosynthesis
MLYIDSLNKRGIYYFTLNLLKYLSKLGKYSDSIQIIRYPLTKFAGLSNITNIPTSISNFVKELNRYNPNLIFIPHPRTYVHAFTPLLASKPMNIVIHDVHFFISSVSISYKFKLLPRYLFIKEIVDIRDNVVLTTVSNFSKLAISHHLNIDPSRVIVIYPGIEEIFKPINRQEAKRYVEEKYGIRKQYLIYSGVISRSKGVYDLIKAFYKLPELIKNYVLVLTGPLEEPEILRVISKADSVKYLGFVLRTDLPFLFSAALAFVYPSYHEGFGFPPLEAAACGTPVIVSRIPVFLETLSNAAFFVETGDVERLADAISIIVNDEDLRVRLSQQALRRARMFSWENTAKRYIELWLEMIK